MMYHYLYGQSWGQPIGLGLLTMIGIGIFAGLLFLVVLALKGYALWHAAKRNEPWWFAVLLIVNTMGILELIYLYFVAGLWHNKTEKTLTTNSNPPTPNP